MGNARGGDPADIQADEFESGPTGAEATAAAGWWLDARRKWHRGSPPPGWWQAHDGLWHPASAEPIPLPPYAEPFWEPGEKTAELADMADVSDTTNGPAPGPADEHGPEPPDPTTVFADPGTMGTAPANGAYADEGDDPGPPRHMAGAYGPGDDEDDDYYDDEDEDWDDDGAIPPWAKVALPLGGLVCGLILALIVLAPSGDAGSDETRTEQRSTASSTSTGDDDSTSAGSGSGSGPGSTGQPSGSSTTAAPNGGQPPASGGSSTSASTTTTTAPRQTTTSHTSPSATRPSATSTTTEPCNPLDLSDLLCQDG